MLSGHVHGRKQVNPLVGVFGRYRVETEVIGFFGFPLKRFLYLDVLITSWCIVSILFRQLRQVLKKVSAHPDVIKETFRIIVGSRSQKVVSERIY